jgi:hypothetical protein
VGYKKVGYTYVCPTSFYLYGIIILLLYSKADINWLNELVCKSALKCYQRAHQFKNLNLLFLTQKRHTRGWGQIINPTHIVMLFFEYTPSDEEE